MFNSAYRVAKEILPAATTYSLRGWLTLPLHSVQPDGLCSCGNAECLEPGQHPRVPVSSATTEGPTIRNWFAQVWPTTATANLGAFASHKSGFVAVQVEHQALSPLWTKYGPLPLTPQIMASDRATYLFKYPRVPLPASAVVTPGVTLLGAGVVVLPPSRVPLPITWAHGRGPQLPLAELPTWLMTSLTELVVVAEPEQFFIPQMRPHSALLEQGVNYDTVP